MCRDTLREHYHILVKINPPGVTKELFVLYKADATIGHIKQLIIDYLGNNLEKKIELSLHNNIYSDDTLFLKNIPELPLYGPHTEHIFVANLQ